MMLQKSIHAGHKVLGVEGRLDVLRHDKCINTSRRNTRMPDTRTARGQNKNCKNIWIETAE